MAHLRINGFFFGLNKVLFLRLKTDMLLIPNIQKYIFYCICVQFSNCKAAKISIYVLISCAEHTGVTCHRVGSPSMFLMKSNTWAAMSPKQVAKAQLDILMIWPISYGYYLINNENLHCLSKLMSLKEKITLNHLTWQNFILHSSSLMFLQSTAIIPDQQDSYNLTQISNFTLKITRYSLVKLTFQTARSCEPCRNFWTSFTFF